MSIEDQLREEMKDNVSRNFDYFRMQDGDNKVRILSEGSVLPQHFFGKGKKPRVCYGISKGCPFHQGEMAPKDKDGNIKQPSIKYTCYVLDRMDDVIKLADLPYSVISKVGELQKNEEWAFEEFPMPYDVTITYKKEESPAKMYSVIGSPKHVALHNDQLDKLAKLMEKASPKDMVQKKKEKQIEIDKQEGIWLDPANTSLTDEQKADIKAVREKAIADKKKKEEISEDEIPF